MMTVKTSGYIAQVIAETPLADNDRHTLAWKMSQALIKAGSPMSHDRFMQAAGAFSVQDLFDLAEREHTL